MSKDNPQFITEMVSVQVPSGTRARVANIYGLSNGPVSMDQIQDLRTLIQATRRYEHPGRVKRARRAEATRRQQAG